MAITSVAGDTETPATTYRHYGPPGGLLLCLSVQSASDSIRVVALLEEYNVEFA